MIPFLLVGIGGFFGAICRYGLAGWLTRALHNPGFPAGILVVNLSGCLLIGIAWGLADARDLFSQNLRLLLFVGFLGGYTTFSSFGFDSFLLLRGGQLGYAVANALLSVLGGLLAVWSGYRAAFKLAAGATTA